MSDNHDHFIALQVPLYFSTYFTHKDNFGENSIDILASEINLFLEIVVAKGASG
jgi:hypothetical protein